jgi:hypothetical protein
VIHVATVHFRSPRWVRVQRDYLERHMSEPFKVWAAVEGIPEAEQQTFDEVVQTRWHHQDKLNLLGHMIVDAADDDDIVIFLDSDAFPIAELMPRVRSALDQTYLIAAQRNENLGDPQPHPLFCATTVARWRDLRGDWGAAYVWRNDLGTLTGDVGGNLLYLLEKRGLEWTPLLRTNLRDVHPVLFGVYGDLIYHHGAGSRRPATRLDKAEWGWSEASNRYVRAIQNAPTVVKRIRRERQMVRDGERIFAELQRDPQFYRAFV